MVPASLIAGAAVIVAGVAVLAAAGRLHRNPIAGIRLPSLYASDTAWRVGHRAAVVPTGAAAVICVALLIVALTYPDFATVGTVVETAVLLIGVLAGAVLASDAARDQRR